MSYLALGYGDKCCVSYPYKASAALSMVMLWRPSGASACILRSNLANSRPNSEHLDSLTNLMARKPETPLSLCLSLLDSGRLASDNRLKLSMRLRTKWPLAPQLAGHPTKSPTPISRRDRNCVPQSQRLILVLEFPTKLTPRWLRLTCLRTMGGFTRN